VVEREVIPHGRTMGFTRSRVLDADDLSRVIAVSSGLGVSLGDIPDGHEKVDYPPIAVDDSPSVPPLTTAFGAKRGDDRCWRLPPLVPELSAPHAALHLGPGGLTHERHEQLPGLPRGAWLEPLSIHRSCRQAFVADS
jgi:hypothetical protein